MSAPVIPEVSSFLLSIFSFPIQEDLTILFFYLFFLPSGLCGALLCSFASLQVDNEDISEHWKHSSLSFLSVTYCFLGIPYTIENA